MKPTGNKLASYIRVSSEKQDTQRQRDAIDGWAARHTLPILFRFEDSEGRNPRDQSAKRADFQALLKAVEARKVDTVIVDAQDRFGTRDAHEWGKFISHLRDYDCELWSVERGLLSGDDDASILNGTLGAMTSAREQRDKSNRNLGGKIAKAKRGEYQGGYPPFGIDVACFGTDGKEKWRVEYLGGHFQREKIYPDGSRERFDGKGNFPAKDPSDVLRYRPTVNAERLAAAQQIFEWYASEDISPAAIGERLKKLGVTPNVGGRLDKTKIRTLLQNPIYLGYPAFNKRSGSRFYGYVNGQIQPANGKGKSTRRQQSDYVQPPEPEFLPIVSEEIWQKVQAKIKGTSFAANGRRSRASRTEHNSELWLRPYIYCGKCGKPMWSNTPVSTDVRKGLTYASYRCSTHGIHGKENPTGCRCHRVKAELVNSIVEEYLDETAPHLREMVEATEGNPGLFHAAFDRLAETLYSRNKLAGEMIRMTGGDWNPLNLSASYGAAYMRRLPEIAQAIEVKEDALDKMVEDFRGLSARLRDRANRRMEALQEEIDALRRQHDDLRKPWELTCEEIRQRAEAMELAAASQGSGGRITPELLRGVVEKILCHFRYKGSKSYLESVEILPSNGPPTNLLLDGPLRPARGRCNRQWRRRLLPGRLRYCRGDGSFPAGQRR